MKPVPPSPLPGGGADDAQTNRGQWAMRRMRPLSRQSGATTLGLLLLGLALAIGIVVAAVLLAGALERIKLAGDRITVKGYAEEKVVSDAGTWRATVSVRAPDLQAGYRRLEADSARVLALLESVAGDQVTVATSPVSLPSRSTSGCGGTSVGFGR